MKRVMGVLLFAFVSAAAAQPDGIEKGKLKKIDADKMTVTIAQGDKDRTFLVDDQTRVFGTEGKDIKDRLKTLKEGSEVQFKPGRRDGKDVLLGIKAADAKAPPPKIDKVDTSKLKALPDLGKGEYQGHKGGLYPDGKNEPDGAHPSAAGVEKVATEMMRFFKSDSTTKPWFRRPR